MKQRMLRKVGTCSEMNQYEKQKMRQNKQQQKKATVPFSLVLVTFVLYVHTDLTYTCSYGQINMQILNHWTMTDLWSIETNAKQNKW